MTELANIAAAAVTSTRPHQFQAMELRLGDVSQATNTAELIKLIRKAGDALDQGMREPGADYFAPKLEALRADCLELFRRLLLRNPYSSYRKDVVSKLWFRTIYPSIEQYRANIKQFESLVGYAAKRPVRDAMDARKEVSRWRAQFQRFLQASTGVLLRIVVELAETNELVALGHLARLSEFAVDYRALATHAYGFEFVDGLQSELHPALSPAQRASLAIISKLLIYLGDLSRYRILYTSKKQGATSVVKAAASRQPQYASGQVINGAHEMWWPAKNFYRGAIKLAPHRGQPQNQLAVVYGYEKNSLDGVFCYYRALTAMHTFPPAEANLRTILENALRAIEDTGADAANAGTTGYLYYENCVYQKFTHLRYLFAIHQPTVKELAALADGRSGADRVSITPEMERQLINDVLAASARFIQGVKSGSIDQRQILVTQAIHIFELQQLCALGADDTESTLHSASVARLSALLVMKVAENLSFAVRCSIIDVLHHPGRMREVKSEAELLSKSSRRAIPPLIQTLLWIVSASVRVVRDALSSESLGTSGGPLVSLLRQKVFAVIKDCNLLDNVNALRSAMEQVQSKVNRRTSPVERVTWRQVLGERLMAPLTQRLWFYGADDCADISGTGVEDSLRLEEELFVGWRLPDGTVWGKGVADQGALVYKVGDGNGSGEHGFQVRWRQLVCLLGLVSECVPAVLSIIDGAKPSLVSEPKSADNLVGSSKLAGAAPVSADALVEDTDEDVEDETICFHGRPQAQQKQQQQQQQHRDFNHAGTFRSVPDAASQSLPPTPGLGVHRGIFCGQQTQQATSEATPDKLMERLELESQMAPLIVATARVSATAATIAAATSGMGVAGDRAKPSVLVDSENDEVVSPAMMASSSHYRANARGAAIGSQRLSSTSALFGASGSRVPLSAASLEGQWPFCASGSSTAPVSPGAAMSVGSAADMALAYSGGIYSPLQASSGQYPGIQSTIVPPVNSTGTNGGGGSSGWESLLQQQQHVMPLAASGMAIQGASTTTASSATAAAGQSAMYAWQQYQVENQRKLALQQQLDQQQRIQQQLQQQLTVQKHQYWPLQATLDSAAAMSALQNLNTMPPPLQNMFAQGDESRQGALSNMYSTYMQRPSTVAATAFGAATSESASASASTSAVVSAAGPSYSAYPWAMVLPAGQNTSSSGSMYYPGQLQPASTLSMSSMPSSSLQRQQAALQGAVLSNTSHYLPMQFTTAAAATATTSMSGGPAIGNRTGHNVGLPSVYGSYGNYGN